jgi:hypothetical protein
MSLEKTTTTEQEATTEHGSQAAVPVQEVEQAAFSVDDFVSESGNLLCVGGLRVRKNLVAAVYTRADGGAICLLVGRLMYTRAISEPSAADAVFAAVMEALGSDETESDESYFTINMVGGGQLGVAGGRVCALLHQQHADTAVGLIGTSSPSMVVACDRMEDVNVALDLGDVVVLAAIEPDSVPDLIACVDELLEVDPHAGASDDEEEEEDDDEEDEDDDDDEEEEEDEDEEEEEEDEDEEVVVKPTARGRALCRTPCAAAGAAAATASAVPKSKRASAQS